MPLPEAMRLARAEAEKERELLELQRSTDERSAKYAQEAKLAEIKRGEDEAKYAHEERMAASRVVVEGKHKTYQSIIIGVVKLPTLPIAALCVYLLARKGKESKALEEFLKL